MQQHFIPPSVRDLRFALPLGLELASLFPFSPFIPYEKAYTCNIMLDSIILQNKNDYKP